MAKSPDKPHSALAGLPLEKWARRFKNGVAHASGELRSPVDTVLAGHPLRVEPGPVVVTVRFDGGPRPAIHRLEVRGTLILDPDEGATPAGELVVEAGRLSLDGEAHAARSLPLGLVPLLQSIVYALADVSADAWAEPAEDVILQFGHGVELRIAAGQRLVARGFTEGSADALRLSRPFVVEFGGDGIQLSHHQFRTLSRLAAVRVRHAELHPDGRVALDGRARGLDLGGLAKASERVGRILRINPQFKRVRAFLKVGGS